MQTIATLKLLTLLSVRNLFSHKVKTVIVGGIMVFGTFLVVLGTTLLDNINTSMQKSITSSMAGNLQVYDKNAKDKLALFGSMSMAQEDIGRMNNYEKVKEAVSTVPNVKAVVPMGIDMASMSMLGELDRTLQELRRAARENKEAEMTVRGKQIQQIAKLMQEEKKNELLVAEDKKKIEQAIAHLERVKSDAFWAQEFKADPMKMLEYLDTEIAPLSQDGKLIYVRYLGTDLDLFAKNFESFAVVKGEMVPKGKRGFLFNEKFYEDQIKHRVARELDAIRTGFVDQAKDPETDGILRAKLSQLPRQYQRITFQLDADESAEVEKELKTFLKMPDAGLDELIKKFLTVDASNIVERREKFYSLIAPKIQLYDFLPGETVTIRAYTRSGYLKAVNVKVWGIFHFTGLERSDLAGGHNLVDLLTFRDLYGYMTEERRAEVDQIRNTVGVKDVGRQNAEDELFGSGGEIVATATAGVGFDEFGGQGLAAKVEKSIADDGRVFDQAAIDRGVALNAAVVLNDGGGEKLLQTQTAIVEATEKAGLSLQVVDWKTAAGFVGQFVDLVQLVLVVAIAIIFAVALVIINNSMITATMERVTEIGTMRAIGAQKSLVLSMFLLETMVLGLISGVLGVAAGALMISYLGSVGIPAPHDVLVFLFAGPRLYPVFGPANLLFGFIAVLFVSILSTMYPARIATRIQPVVAMQRKE